MHQSRAEAVNIANDDVWPERATTFDEVNLHTAERRVSVISGALLLAGGVRRRSLAMLLGGGFLIYRGVTGYCPAYRTLERLAGTPLSRGLQLEESITVNKPVEQVYSLWRRFENLPRFMVHLESVTPTYGDRSHWVARMPPPLRLEWDAAVIDDQENKKISWRSLPGSSIDHSGSVFFHSLPAANGTEMKIILSYEPRGGSVGTAAARLLSILTKNQLRADLRAFKAVAETGEKPTTEGQPSGRLAQRHNAVVRGDLMQ